MASIQSTWETNMLLKYLEKIPDNRRAQGRRYKLHHVLLFTIFAILSGAKSYRDVNRFLDGRLKKLNKLFGLSWKTAPAKTQLREIIARVNKPKIEGVFRCYSEELRTSKIGKGTSNVGLDGKALKGSFDNSNSQDMLQMLSAFCVDTKIILGHTDIDDKTNEIPTAQELIKDLGLPEGTIYTADAMHCQKKHLQQSKKRREN